MLGSGIRSPVVGLQGMGISKKAPLTGPLSKWLDKGRVRNPGQDPDRRCWQPHPLEPEAIWPGQRGLRRPWLTPSLGGLPTADLRHWARQGWATPLCQAQRGGLDRTKGSQPPLPPD